MHCSPLAGQWRNRLSNRMWRCECEIRSDCEYDVGTGRIELPLQAERFSNYPFDAISPDSTPNFAVYTDPDPAVPQVVWPADNGKPPAMQTLALVIYPIKLPTLAQLRVFRK